jgi:hypothetical protein
MASKVVPAQHLRNYLEKSGVKLSAPATIEDIKRLEKVIGGALSPSICSLFLSFNGFDDDYEPLTFISAWPINKIIDNIAISKLPYIPFADRAFDAGIFEVCAVDEDMAILDDGEEAFRDYIAFWDYVISASIPSSGPKS